MPGSSNRTIEYKCGRCGETRERDDLVAVQVRFYELGINGKLLRTRTVRWIGKSCCLPEDPVWKLPRMVLSPGMADVALKGNE